MISTPRTISIITTLLGSAVLAAFGTVAALPIAGHVLSGVTPGGESIATLDGVDTLWVDSDRGHVTVAFADVPAAEITSTSESSTWEWKSTGATLTATNSRPFANTCFFWCGPRDEEQVTITLPAQAEAQLAGEFDLSSGSLQVDGDFDTLDANIGAGTFAFTGSTGHLALELSAGSAHLNAANTHTARFEVMAGRLDGELTGTAPESVLINVAAGQVDLTVPNELYAVSTDVAFGNLNNGLRTDPASARSISLEMAAGQVVLRPAD